MINSKLKYWEPRFLSFDHKYGNGYRIVNNIYDTEIDMDMRHIQRDYPPYYGDIESCINDYMESCSQLVKNANKRVEEAEELLSSMIRDVEILCKNPASSMPGMPEYYRKNNLGLKIHDMPYIINHLKSSRNVAVEIRDEARDMAKELLEIYSINKL